VRKNLINARKKAKQTQKNLATILNITERQYRSIENGKSDGSMKIWKKLRILLNATIDDLEQTEETKQAV